MSWNPRYVAYARAHGRTPEEMRAHDADVWPGGRATGFILWISKQWQRWHEERGLTCSPASWKRHILSQQDHDSFDAELAKLGATA